MVMFDGLGLTTAQIFYRMPDHRSILQTYLWQEYDTYPEFPMLYRFLRFWTKKLDGPLHSVSVSHQRLITPVNFISANFEGKI